MFYIYVKGADAVVFLSIHSSIFNMEKHGESSFHYINVFNNAFYSNVAYFTDTCALSMRVYFVDIKRKIYAMF